MSTEEELEMRERIEEKTKENIQLLLEKRNYWMPEFLTFMLCGKPAEENMLNSFSGGVGKDIGMVSAAVTTNSNDVTLKSPASQLQISGRKARRMQQVQASQMNSKKVTNLRESTNSTADSNVKTVIILHKTEPVPPPMEDYEQLEEDNYMKIISLMKDIETNEALGNVRVVLEQKELLQVYQRKKQKYRLARDMSLLPCSESTSSLSATNSSITSRHSSYDEQFYPNQKNLTPTRSPAKKLLRVEEKASTRFVKMNNPTAKLFPSTDNINVKESSLITSTEGMSLMVSNKKINAKTNKKSRPKNMILYESDDDDDEAAGEDDINIREDNNNDLDDSVDDDQYVEHYNGR